MLELIPLRAPVDARPTPCWEGSCHGRWWPNGAKAYVEALRAIAQFTVTAPGSDVCPSEGRPATPTESTP